MSKIDEWLSEFSKPKTIRSYRYGIDRFFQATNLNEDKLSTMGIKGLKHTILIYRKNQLDKGEPQNSILSTITSVRSFLGYLGKPLKFRKGQLGKVQSDTHSHVFTNYDLKELFDVGDTTEKAIIATAVSLGWEISSFLKLDREKITNLIEHGKANNQQFIFFEDTRAKTGVPRLGVLNPLAIEWLSKYLETSKDINGKLFNYTADGIQKMLNRLAQTAVLKTTGNLRFHNIRKWLMSRLSRCGFNEFQIKYIIGKTIPISDRTYLQTLQTEIEEKYPMVYNDYLNIAPTGVIISQVESKKIIEAQAKIIEGLKKEVEGFKALQEAFSIEREKILKDREEVNKLPKLLPSSHSETLSPISPLTDDDLINLLALSRAYRRVYETRKERGIENG